MKNIILLALTAVMMVGCGEKGAPVSGKVNQFSILTVDSCEYLLNRDNYVGYLAHKGNCKFCAERRQKELEELVIKLKEK